MVERETALVELVNAEKPISASIDRLKVFEWDSEIELVTLKREHIVKILSNYVNGELSKEEIYSWANAIEGREDVGFEEEFEEDITEIIFVIANPEIAEELTKEKALKIINSIR